MKVVISGCIVICVLATLIGAKPHFVLHKHLGLRFLKPRIELVPYQKTITYEPVRVIKYQTSSPSGQPYPSESPKIVPTQPPVEYGPPVTKSIPTAITYAPPVTETSPTEKIYSPPATEYGLPEKQYGPPAKEYSAPPAIEYTTPSSNYGIPADNYGPPATKYIPLATEYSLPAPDYSAPPATNYGTPAVEYKPPSTAYGVPFAEVKIQEFKPTTSVQRYTALPLEATSGIVSSSASDNYYQTPADSYNVPFVSQPQSTLSSLYPTYPTISADETTRTQKPSTFDYMRRPEPFFTAPPPPTSFDKNFVIAINDNDKSQRGPSLHLQHQYVETFRLPEGNGAPERIESAPTFAPLSLPPKALKIANLLIRSDHSNEHAFYSGGPFVNSFGQFEAGSQF